MAELDPYIILRGRPYAGPTQDELDAKQNMNALRNMLGAGQTIDSPEVVNAMMARDPEMGMKLATNASTMQTNQATLQAKQQEARLAELDALVPVGAAIVKAGDQQAWSEFRMHLGQKYPEALTGFPADVGRGGAFLQEYINARRDLKGVSAPLPYLVTGEGGTARIVNRATGQVAPMLDAQGNPLPANAIAAANIGATSRENVANIGATSRESVAASQAAAAAERQVAKQQSDAAQKGVNPDVVVRPGETPSATGGAPNILEAKRLAALKVAEPKARAALAAADEKFNTMTANIDALLKDPALKDITGDELARYRGSFPSLFGPGAARAQARLDQLKAQGGFSELSDMRAASPTGGAIGNVSDAEGGYLRAAFGRFEQAQSVKDMVAALTEIQGILARSRERIHQAYEKDFAPINSAASPNAVAPPAAPAGEVNFGDLK